MKKFFFLLPLVLLSGCTQPTNDQDAQPTTDIQNQLSGLTEQMVGLNDQVSGLNSQIQNLAQEDSKVQESETTEVTTTGTTDKSDRYWKIYSNKYSIYNDGSNPDRKDDKSYKIYPVGKEECIYLTQYNGTFKSYVASFGFDQPTDTKGTSLIGRKTWNCGYRLGEREVCFTESTHGSLIVTVEDAKGDRDYDAKDILKVIDF